MIHCELHGALGHIRPWPVDKSKQGSRTQTPPLGDVVKHLTASCRNPMREEAHVLSP